ncbi:MAG: hypothetical protein [Caudoviricetes sp.]|nr:MAG: hypothetical protein [Caudoviricetes sp.]
MNLRQLEEMVNVLKSKGYSPETVIYIGNYDEELKNITNIVSSIPDAKKPTHIMLGTDYRPFPNCYAFNCNFTENSIHFPLNFPAP